MLFVMAICAYTDYKEGNIYLFPLLCGAFASFLLFVGQLVLPLVLPFCIMTQGRSFLGEEIYLTAYMTEYLIFPCAFMGLLLMLSYATKGQIGQGDGYLCGAVGVIAGIRICVCTVLYGSILCSAAVGVFGLMENLKKREIRKDLRIPFAPFALVGFVISAAAPLL